jgi:hypothetical protein
VFDKKIQLILLKIRRNKNRKKRKEEGVIMNARRYFKILFSRLDVYHL